MLLETTVATGLLVAGLAVIGAQIQQAESSVREMELRLRALMLAETMLAELDLGLVELDSVDFVQEGDFGPRYPDFAWRLITEESSIDDLYGLRLDVLYLRTDEPYEPDTFDHDSARSLHTVYALRALPQELDLGTEFGLDDEAVLELGNRLDVLAISGLSVDSFDPTLLASLNFEDFIEVLPLIADAFGIDITQLLGQLPPEVVRLLEEGGLLGEEGEEGGEVELNEQPSGSGEE